MEMPLHGAQTQFLRRAGSRRGRLRGWIAPFWIFALAVCEPGFSQNGFESTNRPSEFRPPLPDFSSRGPAPKFVLPPVPPEPEEAPDSASLIRIDRIVIEGNTVLPDDDLRRLVKDFENREVSAADLEGLRQDLTRLYNDAGYANSGAVFPENALKNRELRIRIIEGRLNEISVRGEGNLPNGYIQSRLLGDSEKPLNVGELEERFQLLLSDPLIRTMNGKILPGAAPGQSILDLEVARSRPYRLSLFGDNFRPPQIGANAFGLNGSLLNPLGFGEILDFTFVTSEGSKRYSGGLSLPINRYGTQVFFRFDEGDAQVIEQPLRASNIVSKVHSLEGGIAHPVFETLRQRLNLGLLLAVRESETRISNIPKSFFSGTPYGHNQVTVWRVYQDYLGRWDRHAFALRSNFSIGMNALGATQPNRDYASSEFFSWLGQIQYAYQIDEDGTQLVLRGNAQFADRALLPLEKIAVGGVSSVRGYRMNTLVKDNGYTLTAELHYPLFRYQAWGSPGRLDIIPFMDFGQAWDAESPSKALWSVGAGLQWRHEPLFTEIYYGYAINRMQRPGPKAFDDLQDNGLSFQVRLNVF